MELRERVARKIAAAITRCDDTDVIVTSEWPPTMKLVGGFSVVPTTGAPLWQFFLPAADVAIGAVEEEGHCYAHCSEREYD